MAKNRILYLFTVIAAGVFASAYSSKLTFVLFLALLFLPAATLLLLIMERLALKFEVSPGRVFSQKLQQFSVTVTARNRFLVPISPMKLTGAFQNEDGELVPDKTMIVSIMPFRTTQLVFGGCLKYRGEYRLGLSEAVIYDLLGIFRFRIKLSPDTCVVVAPRRLSIEQSGALCSDDNDSSRTRRSFIENNSFSSVREYVDGDTLRYVHWKLSAKQDKLMVKQMEQDLGTNALIITDTCALFEDEQDNIRAVDAAIEASLAITSKIIGDGRCALNLFRTAESAPAELVPAESADDYENLYYAFSVLPILGKNGATALVQEIQERLVDSETVFITTASIDTAELRQMLDGGLASCKTVWIFLTGCEPDSELVMLSQTEERLKIGSINPDDVARSLREALAG